MATRVQQTDHNNAGIRTPRHSVLAPTHQEERSSDSEPSTHSNYLDGRSGITTFEILLPLKSQLVLTCLLLFRLLLPQVGGLTMFQLTATTTFNPAQTLDIKEHTKITMAIATWDLTRTPRIFTTYRLQCQLAKMTMRSFVTSRT